MLQNLIPRATKETSPLRVSKPALLQKPEQKSCTSPKKVLDIKEVPSKIVARMILAKRKRVSNYIQCPIPGCDHKANCVLSLWKHIQNCHSHHSFCDSCAKICDPSHVEEYLNNQTSEPPCKRVVKSTYITPVNSNDKLSTMSTA